MESLLRVKLAIVVVPCPIWGLSPLFAKGDLKGPMRNFRGRKEDRHLTVSFSLTYTLGMHCTGFLAATFLKAQ